MPDEPSLLTKLKWSLPWLTRYPFWRARELSRRFRDGDHPRHLIFVVANHFEPGWNVNLETADWPTQIERVERWREQAERIGATTRDCDGRPFRHTYFFPIEQYHWKLLDQLAQMQAEDLGEVEIHLHHGVDKPDTAENLRRILVEMRDVFANEHRCLSRMEGVEHPMYAFVHGNLALANSAGGIYCGVDEEMRILAETGCYVDMTLPSAPDRTQVPKLNAIYQCGRPFEKAAPHRSGEDLRVGQGEIKLPIIFTGPLVFNWKEKVRAIPAPRLDDGSLALNQPMDLARLERWRQASISVAGRPDWVFIKLVCHGFFDYDQDSMIGPRAEKFFGEVIEYGERTGEYKVHFATAREAYNMVRATVDGKEGSPGQYRDYSLKSIMQSAKKTMAFTM